MPDNHLKDYTYIGANTPIAQAALKATGQMMYTADMKLPHMLHAKVLFSTHPHARIRSIDTTAALEAPGVVAIYTADDLVADGVGHLPAISEIKDAAGNRHR